MNKAQTIEKNIRSIFHESQSMDLGFLDILANLDFSVLSQVIRHHAETVYVYRINTMQGFGPDYRGPELFPVRATMLYSCLFPFSDKEHGVVRVMELWMLDDGTLAAVNNTQIILGRGAVVSEYRTVKSTVPSEICQVIPIDRSKLAGELRDLCRISVSVGIPCYEL